MKHECRVLAQPLTKRGYCALEQLVTECGRRVLEQRCAVRFPVAFVSERECHVFVTSTSIHECRVLKQRLVVHVLETAAECKCRV